MKTIAKTIATLLVGLFLLVLTNPAISATPGGEKDWTLLKTVQGVQVFYQYGECHDNANGLHYEYVYLKFVNTTQADVVVNWTEELWYNGKCRTCQGSADQPLFTLKLNAGQTREGACGQNIPEKMRIFSKFLNYDNKPELTKFELVNFAVTAQ
jgi:hypothetical protein